MALKATRREEWLLHYGPSWSIAILLGLAPLAVVWRRRVFDSVGQLLVAAIVLAMLWLNVWIWVEPANYAAARPLRMQHESYIRSIDEYYGPFEKLLDRAATPVGG